MRKERRPAVAGLFYPEEKATLEAEVRSYLEAAEPRGVLPKALIAPHAGYAYSGPVAGHAYRQLEHAASIIERIVLLGPAHRVALRGLGVPTVAAFKTPLGSVPIDAALRESVLELPQVSTHDAAHAPEHSLEVHVPFLQVALDTFTLLPLVVGEAETEEVAQVLERVWAGSETVFVVSTDLSHYLPYEAANRIDDETARSIEALEGGGIDGRRACGFVGLKGLLEVARRRGMEIERLDLRSSGDTAGSKDHVVGYGAWILTEPARAA